MPISIFELGGPAAHDSRSAGALAAAPLCFAWFPWPAACEDAVAELSRVADEGLGGLSTVRALGAEAGPRKGKRGRFKLKEDSKNSSAGRRTRTAASSRCRTIGSWPSSSRTVRHPDRCQSRRRRRREEGGGYISGETFLTLTLSPLGYASGLFGVANVSLMGALAMVSLAKCRQEARGSKSAGTVGGGSAGKSSKAFLEP